MKTLKQIAVIVLGTVIAAYGISLAIHAGFGGATLTVLWDGINRTFGPTIGQASFGIAVLMVVFCWFYDRKQISWGTIIYQVIYSSCVDFFHYRVFYTESAVFNALLMVLGIAIFAFGAAMYSSADFGRGPYEALTLAFVHRRGWQVSHVRITEDLTCAVLGVLLGGKIGLCTVATILLTGYLLQYFLQVFRKLWEKTGFLK